MRTKKRKPKIGENLALREEYGTCNRDCELWEHRARIWRPEWDHAVERVEFWRSDPPSFPPSAIHHIWHRGARWDFWSNLITLCGPFHQLLHDKSQNLLTLACLLVKHRKGETDWDELDHCAGQCVLAWVERLTDLPPEYERMRRELPL